MKKNFKVGDKIIARRDVPYETGWLLKGWKGYVVKVHGNEGIEVVQAMSGKNESKRHFIRSCEFDLLESISYKIVKCDKYEVGDKVKIVDKWTNKTDENRDMDKWLGKVMTIRRTTRNNLSESGIGYLMEEDKYEFGGIGWNWNSYCIEGKIIENSQKALAETVKLQSLKIGTVVQGIGKDDGKKIDGKTGIITKILYDRNNTPYMYGVRFAEEIGGHDCQGTCLYGHGLFVPDDKLKVLDTTNGKHLVLMLHSPCFSNSKDIGYVGDLTLWKDMYGEHLFIGDQVDYGTINRNGKFESHGRCVVSTNLMKEVETFAFRKYKGYKKLKVGDRFGYIEVVKLPSIVSGTQKTVICKDCRYYTESSFRCDHPQLDYDVECYDHWLETMPNDFCSYGEEKDKEVK